MDKEQSLRSNLCASMAQTRRAKNSQVGDVHVFFLKNNVILV